MKATPVNIKHIASLVSESNREAFNLFFNLYYEQVFRFAYYFLRSKEDCREVVTDVFFAVWQSRVKLQEVENIETYLYIVARNEATRFQRRNANNTHLSLEDIPMQLEERSDDSPEEELVGKEMEELLTSVINGLPEKCRLVFMMVRQEGLKPKEIATILGINESTVRVQLKIAIDKIITRLKPHFPNISFSLLLIFLLL